VGCVYLLLLYVDLILLNDDLFSFCVDLILLYIDLILTSPYPFRPIYWKDIHAKEDEAGLLKKDLFMEAVEAMENSGTFPTTAGTFPMAAGTFPGIRDLLGHYLGLEMAKGFKDTGKIQIDQKEFDLARITESETQGFF
jgi:hypothetical protein